MWLPASPLWLALGVLALASPGLPGNRSGVPGVRHQSNTTEHPSYTEYPIYIVAHQDDWQLFMGDLAAVALGRGVATTFIYLTAGDDGRDSTYWSTRERAALESVRIASGVNARRSEVVCAPTTMAAHTIRRCTFANTTSYFLRLPDGRRNGAGFARYGNQSLRKLKLRTINSIQAVDRSTSYSSWQDLVATVDAIARSSNVTPILNATDPSITINPHDHFDHRIVGLLAEEVRKRHGWRARYYVGYAVASRASNRGAEAVRAKTAIFRAYDAVMIRANPAWSAYSEHPTFYSECMQRTYARSVPRASRR
jgi:LmbE family N-acetylglucosaminyl deacetylase